MTDRFVNKVLSWTKRRGLLRPGDRVIVGVSGGADSMALLEVLATAGRSKPWNFQVEVAHFDHGLRGEESRRDAEFVREIASRLELPFHTASEDVRSFARKEKTNLEQACRHRRYSFLREVAGRIGANRIATGHTMSDQAETFLMRLLRGAGGEGLASIRPSLEGLIVRPLLGVTREEVRDFCARRSIAYRDDASNSDLRFLRNRVRLEILPVLAQANPQIVSALARTAELLLEDESFLQETARREFERLTGEAKRPTSADRSLSTGNLRAERLPVAVLRQLPAPLRQRVLRESVRRVKGNLTRITAAHVEALDRLVRTLQSGRQFGLPGKMTVRREFDEIILSQGSAPPGVLSEKIEAGCDRTIEWLHLRVGVHLADKTDEDPDDFERAVLDARKVRLPITLRSRKPGERYIPYKKRTPVTLKEMMMKKRIPATERSQHVIFADADGEFIWSPGLPLAAKYQVDESTTQVLILRCERSRA